MKFFKKNNKYTLESIEKPTYSRTGSLVDMDQSREKDKLIYTLRTQNSPEQLRLLVEISELCRKNNIPYSDITGMIKNNISEYLNQIKFDYEKALQDLWQEKKRVDSMESELESMRNAFTHKRGIFYCLSVLVENARLSNGIITEKFSKKMTDICNRMLNVMQMYGSFDENNTYSFFIKEGANFTFDAYVDFSGIRIRENSTIDEYRNMINKIEDLKETVHSKGNGNNLYDFYLNMWNVCNEVIFKVADFFDEKNTSALCENQINDAVAGIVEEIIHLFEKCDVKFVTYTPECDELFTKEDALSKAAVYNSRSDTLLQKGNVEITKD